jgi:uncharacterized protein YmfQ (DUF2313 family)
MMTETISRPESQAAESPHLPRPETDGAALRAIADHETLIALHEMAKQQLEILNGQDRVLAILDNFAGKDMPGRQRHIQDCVDQVLAKVDPGTAEG